MQINSPALAPYADLFHKLEEIQRENDAKVHEIRAAVRASAQSENGANDEIRRLVSEGRSIRAKSLWVIRDLQRRAGITEAEIRRIERAQETEGATFPDSPWHGTIFDARPTEDLDHLVETGYEQLMRVVDRNWLSSQRRENYRLSRNYLTRPLNMVNGVRISDDERGPQRFARMLLVTEDHLNKRDELDFFSACNYVPEVAALGNSLAQIAELGAEAKKKFALLKSVPDDMVTSAIFEFLVGSACVDKGLDLHMIPETRDTKVPDFRLTSFGALPCVIECKRRLGLSGYELQEARAVEQLYYAMRKKFQEKSTYGMVEAVFHSEVTSVSEATFSDAIARTISQGSFIASWGGLTFEERPTIRSTASTRLYSEDFLKDAFNWESYNTKWDGLVCEVNPPASIRVELIRRPLCLKWRSESPDAMLKKARGVSSLWSKAIKQVAPGDMGFIYIAYPEGARSEVADARTRHILATMPELYHPWFVQVPITVISRLYPRALGSGTPDLIENVLPGAAKGNEDWLKHLPHLIFTRPLSRRT